MEGNDAASKSPFSFEENAKGLTRTPLAIPTLQMLSHSEAAHRFDSFAAGPLERLIRKLAVVEVISKHASNIPAATIALSVSAMIRRAMKDMFYWSRIEESHVRSLQPDLRGLKSIRTKYRK